MPFALMRSRRASYPPRYSSHDRAGCSKPGITEKRRQFETMKIPRPFPFVDTSPVGTDPDNSSTTDRQQTIDLSVVNTWVAHPPLKGKKGHRRELCPSKSCRRLSLPESITGLAPNF